MNICNVVPRVDEEASGPSYSVPRLCEGLAAHGHQSTLVTLQSRRTVRSFADVIHEEFAYRGLLRKLGFSKSMKKWFKANVINFDVIHSHGLWMMPNIYSANYSHSSNVPFIVSPRGTLSAAAMQYSRRAKAVFWALKQKAALQKVAGFHATCQEEYNEIRALGFTQPVAIISNGIDIPPMESGELSPKSKTVLSLGRIHPKKGLEFALEAWSKVQEEFPEWKYRIVGHGAQNYIHSLQSMISNLGLKRVCIEGPLFGEAKLEAYGNASLFILPTRNENFGMVVAEALSVGTPVITTQGAPWKGLETHNCGWWVEISSGAIEKALSQAMGLSGDKLNQMGKAGRNWMSGDFQWSSVAGKMHDFYKWIIDPEVQPKFVVVD